MLSWPRLKRRRQLLRLQRRALLETPDIRNTLNLFFQHSQCNSNGAQNLSLLFLLSCATVLNVFEVIRLNDRSSLSRLRQPEAFLLKWS
ncbi:unnamed protein product [Linum tenue]|uniref:Uncharacterized protein n=1 Tax=Linum tenue TaxID=586396 RepID=A0AAV0M3F9_9ROSI|nr:unnamed protein product [Linum tenue]